MYAIGYSWGSTNHIIGGKMNKGEIAPDNTAYKAIADFMKKNAPGNNNTNYKIPEYPVETLTNGIYACDGTLEDWAYSGGWEE